MHQLFQHNKRRALLRLIASILNLAAISCLISACAHGGGHASDTHVNAEGLLPLATKGPVELKLKGTLGQIEKVAYLHKSFSKSYEDAELRAQKEESLEFTSQAETIKSDSNKFTQIVEVVKKDGTADMHDFAMPELGEKLAIISDSRGHILKAGDYPSNSVFFVSPVSLPEGPVNVGDTWTMQATWLSLDEMVPFQLDMLSILKGLWACGKDRCAEIEIQGDVSLQGALVKNMAFTSSWKGRIYFDIDAGTVLWSRVDSKEDMVAERVRRGVSSCLEAVLVEPQDIKLAIMAKPSCSPAPVNKDAETAPAAPAAATP